MDRVIIESPYGSTIDGGRCGPEELMRNTIYVRNALLDCLRRGEAPFASHAIYPLAGLDESLIEERRLGMDAGFKWGEVADRVVVYIDYGFTAGMREGIIRWEAAGMAIENRSIGTIVCLVTQ